MSSLLVPLLALTVTPFVSATFSDGFQTFLQQTYGPQVASELTRLDQGVNGSFGGGFSSHPIKVYKDPLVIIHGLNDNAGTMGAIRQFFLDYGYGDNEIYITTYGPNGTTVSADQDMSCTYVKQLRQLIVAVNAYTHRTVVTLGYSLGVPLLRKAILGGVCLDTNENVGDPLTSQISVFLSTAGANEGALECTQYPTFNICNNNTGIFPGSKFIKDINSKVGYEGEHRFYIRSSTDEVVGYEVGKVYTAALAGSNVNVTFNNFTHVDTCFNTLYTQFSLVTTGHASNLAVEQDAAAESKLTGLKCSGSVTGDNNGKYSQPKAPKNWGGQGNYDHSQKIYTFPSGQRYFFHAKYSGNQYFGSKAPAPAPPKNNNNNKLHIG